MKSSDHPLEITDTSRLILSRLSMNKLRKVKRVSKAWHKTVSDLTPIKKLMEDFNVVEDTAFSLTSPRLVYQRLAKIIERGRYPLSNEHVPYVTYCSSRQVDSVFVHLLDTGLDWFRHYFAERDTFFLFHHLVVACTIGNLELVKFLLEEKHCQLQAAHVYSAVGSGQLELVTYLFGKKGCQWNVKLGDDLFHAAIMSGNVLLMEYLQSKFIWDRQAEDFARAVHSGSLEMVKFMVGLKMFHVNAVNYDDFSPFISLSLIKYLVEELSMNILLFNLHGFVNACSIGYTLGRIDVVKYFEECFLDPLVVNSRKWLQGLMAVRSGDWATFQYFLKKIGNLKNAPTTFTQFMNSAGLRLDSVLSDAIQGGNLSIIKFMVEECKWSTQDIDLFHAAIQQHNLAAIRQHNLDVVRYAYAIQPREVTTDDLLASLSPMYYPSLQVITWLVEQCKNIDYAKVSVKCIAQGYFMILHHLIEHAHFPVTHNMLADVFNGYLQVSNRDAGLAFMEYLINVHHLKPTQKMLDEVREKKDDTMLAILQKNVPDSEKAVPSFKFG